MANEPPTKKLKSDDFPPFTCPEHKANLARMLVKDAEPNTLHELLDMPVSSLQGIADRADAMMDALNVKTIKDLAQWKFYAVANAMVVCAGLEDSGARPDGSVLNIDHCVVKEHETKTFTELIALPPHALEGLTQKADELLKEQNITTIEKLGSWKYIQWAQAVFTLSAYEETKSPEMLKAEALLKRLD